MDQESLVTEQIEAGRSFLVEFDKDRPVQAAFWLKETEDSGWYLYVASDEITDANIAAAYGDVARAARNVQDPNFDRFRVRLVGVGDTRAKAALEIYRQFPGRVPARVSPSQFGPLGAESVYLYPPQAAAASK
jgi:hypothetical protein